MPEQVVNGVRLYYEEHGAGAPILCIHGGGSTALMWEDAVAELARLGRVIAYFAAPKAPGKKKLRQLIVELKIHARPVVSPIPSKVIAQVGLRMIELLAPLR